MDLIWLICCIIIVERVLKIRGSYDYHDNP